MGSDVKIPAKVDKVSGGLPDASLVCGCEIVCGCQAKDEGEVTVANVGKYFPTHPGRTGGGVSGGAEIDRRSCHTHTHTPLGPTLASPDRASSQTRTD